MIRSALFPKIIAALLLALFVGAPGTSQASIVDFTKSAAKWWFSRSIGASVTDADAKNSQANLVYKKSVSDDTGGITDEEDGSAGGEISGSAVPGKCQVPQGPPITECDIGSGFLCVSTPPAGIADSSFILKGTIDRQSSVLASIKIIAQNEYTKEITEVNTSDPAESGCWDSTSFGRPFCLDSDGRFAVLVELIEEGPYTVSVSASQLSGDSAQSQVRISRVIPTDLSLDDIAFNPDVKSVKSVDTSHITVTVDLLGDCQFCDFIGASTGGVSVSVENIIINESGEQKIISCATTVEQGGQGKFVVGVPVGSGENSLTIRACNAAALGSACPEVSGIMFTASGVVEVSDSVEFLSPDPFPSYDSETYPVIPWRFKLGNSDACVEVRFNRQAPIKLCPNSQRIYAIDLNPRRGINVVSLAQESGADEFAWVFGWGKIISPYASEEQSMEIFSAIELGIPADALSNILIPFINNFLASDERNALLRQMLDKVSKGDESSDNSDILSVIPHCSVDNESNFTYELRGDPKIGQVVFKHIAFEKDEMHFSVVLKDVEIGLDLIPYKELEPLPLTIAFRAAKLDLILVNSMASSGQPLILLTAPHNDCEFKNGTYCKQKPAPLVPANLVGNANGYGTFLKCETSLVSSDKALEACNAINSLNAMTGVVHEKLLDALNDAIYCGGSSALTTLARQGVSLPPVVLGCEGSEECTGVGAILANVTIPIAVSLKNGVNLFKAGILADADVMIGNNETYSQTPVEYQVDSAGIIAGDGFGESSFDTPKRGGDVNLAASLDAINAFLFAATAQGNGHQTRGLFDFDVHEGFFKELDFDFIKECDEYEAPEGEEASPPRLCQIRPRVSVLLGTALTTYGYFPGNHPLLLAVRGNRALGARISVADITDLPVVQQEEGEAESSYVPSDSLLSVDIGGLTLTFYALEVDENLGTDEYGNLAIKTDANGNPIIQSMHLDDSDPWNGPIISFDLSLLLGVEISAIEPDPQDDSNFKMNLKVLGDRSRLVLTPVAGSNATTVPAAGLVSALAEKLKLALAELEDFDIPIPSEIALSADDDGVFNMLGLAKITFDSEGLKLDLEKEQNTAVLALSAAITQILHQSGEEVEYELH